MVEYSRRELLGAMAAVFCGVALPEPVRELIRLPTLAETVRYTSPMPFDMDELIRICHDIFVTSITENVRRETLVAQLFNGRRLMAVPTGEMVYSMDLKFQPGNAFRQ